MSPNKLTDTQLVLLSAASKREDGAMPEAPLSGGTENACDSTLDKPSPRTAAPRKPTANRRAAAHRKGSKEESRQQLAKPRPRSSKQFRVIEMLQRAHGTTIDAIVKATGWQPHSVRGFFAGVVRKRLGLDLRSEKADGDRVYRIVYSGGAGSGSRRSRRRAA